MCRHNYAAGLLPKEAGSRMGLRTERIKHIPTLRGALNLPPVRRKVVSPRMSWHPEQGLSSHEPIPKLSVSSVHFNPGPLGQLIACLHWPRLSYFVLGLLTLASAFLVRPLGLRVLGRNPGNTRGNTGHFSVSVTSHTCRIL